MEVVKKERKKRYMREIKKERRKKRTECISGFCRKWLLDLE